MEDWLLGVRFCSGQAFSQEFDLAGVMCLVLADVEPLTEIVRRTPEPVFVDGHEPRVIALAAGSGGEGFATIGSATGPGTRLGSLGPWYRVDFRALGGLLQSLERIARTSEDNNAK